VAVDAEARLQKFGVDVDGHIELGQKPEDGDALTPVELRRRSRLEIPYVRLNRTAGRVAPFPGAVGERMLREGGVDPQVVSDWLARCPFNIGYERWYGHALLRDLASAIGPFARRRPGQIQQDVEGFDPSIHELLKALTVLGDRTRSEQARTTVHWCQNVLVNVEAADSMHQGSLDRLRDELERALVDATNSRRPRYARAVGKAWARALRRALR